MDDLLKFLFLLLVGFDLFLILCIYSIIELWMTKHKYSKTISVFNQYGYRFYSDYSYKGKGLVYRKQLDKTTIDSLLIRYKHHPLDFEVQYKIYDYVALIKYPEWEEKYYMIRYSHGGLRLIHYYTMVVIVGDNTYYRPLDHYLCNDMEGYVIAPCVLENKDTIEHILTSNIRCLIDYFCDQELKYWRDKIKDMDY